MIELPQKIVCVGLNYRDHAEEQGVELPKQPLLFAKWPNTLIASGEAIRIPAICENPDYEAELGVVIGRRASGVAVDDALDFVRGYVV
ncbi:MAG: fumarylacetoacetate hydrolase family protein, partial [Actinomycetota bacterium]